MQAFGSPVAAHTSASDFGLWLTLRTIKDFIYLL